MNKHTPFAFFVSVTLGCLAVASLPAAPAHAWTRYNAETRPTMILGPKTGMADDPDGDFRELLAPMIKYSRETSLTHGGLMDAWHVTDNVLP